MYLSTISLVALASAPLTLAQLPGTPVAPTPPISLRITLPTAFTYPTTQILPVPGWNTTTDSFNTLATLYSSSSAKLASQVVAIAQKNIQLSGAGGVQYSYDVQASLASSLAIVNNLLWETAYEAERKVCAIVSSINEQNVESVKGNLVVAINAQIQAILSITVTLSNTIAAVQALIVEFTEAERAVLSTLIQAIATAATASIGPVDRLNAGLSATGITALSEVVGTLQSVVASLQAVATINWTIQ